MTDLLVIVVTPVTMLLLAGAIVINPPNPVERAFAERDGTVAGDPKQPRDGPAGGKGGLFTRIWPFLGRGGTRRVDRLAVAADIGLFAACVRAGLSPGTAAAAVAASAAEDTAELWSDVAKLLAVGVDPTKAWNQMTGTPGLSELAGITRMSHRSGAAIATGCERIAGTLRSEAADAAQAAAERAGVFIALPLAVCFLPGFIVLGLAPVVISLGLELLG